MLLFLTIFSEQPHKIKSMSNYEGVHISQDLIILQLKYILNIVGFIDLIDIGDM